ncbi:MAG TPA: hypothetical protein VFD90_02045 [Gaiellales bacterium]|nr:hypothetical protein [Gaiellales bacterium]
MNDQDASDEQGKNAASRHRGIARWLVVSQPLAIDDDPDWEPDGEDRERAAAGSREGSGGDTG